MNFGKLAAGALTAITLAGSLPVAAAPIFDPGAHYIIKFEGAPLNATTGYVTGQITLSAEAYRSGLNANVYAGRGNNVTGVVPVLPQGLVSLDLNINDTFILDTQSINRITEKVTSDEPGADTNESSLTIDIRSSPYLSNFKAQLLYIDQYLTDRRDYQDLDFLLSGNGVSGTVVGSYAYDEGQGFGCSEASFRCQFTSTYAVSVPEPASLALLGTGVVGLMAMRRRRKAV